MASRRIAVVGMGTAGSAAALFLARAGHRVTVYEKQAEANVGALYQGAGLGMQPIGLRCLQRLGLLESVLAHGAHLDGLTASTKEGKPVLDLHYADLVPSLFGMGLHRSVLFGELLAAMRKEENIDLRFGTAVTNAHVPSTPLAEADKPHRTSIVHEGAPEGEEYDLVVAADGRSSALRHMAREGGHSIYEQWYPYGCLWSIVPDTDGFLERQGSQLVQRLNSAKQMVGFLPTGRVHVDASALSHLQGKDLVTIFWSLDMKHLDGVRAAGLPAWKDSVTRLEPKAAPLLANIQSFSELLPAYYSNVVMSRLDFGSSCVFIGDAAHATSPQLGQGANLALVDAWKLAKSLEECPDNVSGALRLFDSKRRWRLRFYQLNSMFLTPAFQSDSRLVGAMRDASFHALCKFPPSRWQMLAVMAGAQNNGIPYSTIPADEYILRS